MAYATAAEMKSILGEEDYLRATDRDGDGSEDSGVADQALESATALINSYIANELPLPDPIPTHAANVLRNAAIRLAHYECMGSTGTEEVRLRAKDTREWLRDVAKGKASLGIDDGTEESAGAPDFDTKDRVMTRSTMSGVL